MGINDLANLKSHRELAMSPTLLAFNQFASALRVELRDRNAPMRFYIGEEGLSVEKIIGLRWKNLSQHERDVRIANAVEEQNQLKAEGGVPAMSSGLKARKKAARFGPDGELVAKRRRGRPPKLPLSGGAVGMLHPGTVLPTTLGLDPRAGAFMPTAVINIDCVGSAPHVPPGGDDLLGQRVEGQVDGVFDAGYFLTVRVGSQVLRGLVYREDIMVHALGNHHSKQKAEAKKNAVSTKVVPYLYLCLYVYVYVYPLPLSKILYGTSRVIRHTTCDCFARCLRVVLCFLKSSRTSRVYIHRGAWCRTEDRHPSEDCTDFIHLFIAAAAAAAAF